MSSNGGRLAPHLNKNNKADIKPVISLVSASDTLIMDNHLDVRAKPTNFLQQLSSVALVLPIQSVCLLCRLLTGTKSPDESDKTRLRYNNIDSNNFRIEGEE